MSNYIFGASSLKLGWYTGCPELLAVLLSPFQQSVGLLGLQIVGLLGMQIVGLLGLQNVGSLGLKNVGSLSLKNVGSLFFQWLDSPLGGLGRLIFRGFTITHFRHTTLGRTPLDE
jgi:hypothetical protein